MTKTPDAQASSPDEAVATSENTASGTSESSAAQSAGGAAAGSAAMAPDKPEATHRRAVTAGTAPAIDRNRRPLASRAD